MLSSEPDWIFCSNASILTTSNSTNLTIAELDPDINACEINWDSIKDYELSNKLGSCSRFTHKQYWHYWAEGKCSDVYKAIDVRNGKDCVVKIMREDVDIHDFKREVRILQDLDGGPNILHFIGAVTDRNLGVLAIVTEYINKSYYRNLYTTSTDQEVRYYTFQLLRALDHAHNRNIMHRDIKPHNIMIDHQAQKVSIAGRSLEWFDWLDPASSDQLGIFWVLQGWSELYHKCRNSILEITWNSTWLWTVHSFIEYVVIRMYNCWNDLSHWTFLSQSGNVVNQIIEIIKVLGTQELFNWIIKNSISLPDEFDRTTDQHEKRLSTELLTSKNERLAVDEVIDLLNGLLVWDHEVSWFDSQDSSSHFQRHVYLQVKLYHIHILTRSMTWHSTMNLPLQFGISQGSGEATPNQRPCSISVIVTLCYTALQQATSPACDHPWKFTLHLPSFQSKSASTN